MGAEKVKVYVWYCEKCGLEWETVGEKNPICPNCGVEGKLVGEYEE